MDGRFFEDEILNVWVEEDEPEEVVSERFKKLNAIAEHVYSFVLNYSYYLNSRREYGPDYKLTMLEAHVLNDIADNPGITVSEIAKKWKRTTSSISQVVKRLLKWGYISRVINEENAKYINLFPLDKGKDFVLCHKRYDNVDIVKTNKILLKNFTPDELAVFYNVLIEYNKIIDELG